MESPVNPGRFTPNCERGACGFLFLIGFIVNTPPAKAGGFGLRLKAGSIGHSAD